MHIIFESVLMLFAKNCQNLLTLVKIFLRHSVHGATTVDLIAIQQC